MYKFLLENSRVDGVNNDKLFNDDVAAKFYLTEFKILNGYGRIVVLFILFAVDKHKKINIFA